MGTAVNIEVCPSNMKSFAFLAIVLVSASAIHIPEKYAHYKPGYMRIPDWEKIMSGEKKLNQNEPTMKFEPRSDYLPRADCGIPNAKSNNKIVGGQEATPHQFPWQVGLFFDGYFCGGSIISEKYILTAAHCADGVFSHEVVIGAHEIRDSSNPLSMPMAQLFTLNGTASPSPTIWLSWNLRLKSTGLNLETMLLLTAWPLLETSLDKLLWYLDGDSTLILPAASALS